MHHFKNFSGLNYRDFPPVKIVKKKKKIYSHVNLLQQSIARRSLKRYNKQLYKNLKKKAFCGVHIKIFIFTVFKLIYSVLHVNVKHSDEAKNYIISSF